MNTRTITLTDALYDYLLSVSLREHPLLRDLRAETAAYPEVQMQISPEQGQFMAFLAKLTDARRCIEVGVFTGYSSLSIALVLPDDGRIVACDVSEQWTAVARRYWRAANVEHKIDLRLAPALQTLDGLLVAGAAGSYDFAFVDADKQNYTAYYERMLKLVKPNGLLLFDNTLWSGAVADPNVSDGNTNALRALNELLHHDERIDLSLTPIGDGLTLVRKR